MSNSRDTNLTKKDVQKAALFWHATSHMTYNYQRLQAGSMTSMMGPVLDKIYPNDNEKMKEGLQRHMLYFNTEPRFGAIIPGIAVALEEGIANDTSGELDPSIVAEIKTALMGPLAGIGDTIWAGLIKPVILGIVLGWALEGHVWGAWVYGLGVTILDLAVTYFMFMRGYQLGIDSVDRFLEGGFVKKVTTFLGIVGLFVLGAMIVRFVGISAVYEINLATGTINLGTLLDRILPKLLPLLFTLLGFFLLNKGKKVPFVLLALFVVGFIGGALGILG